ncbi:MAG: insulinase family protein [Sphingobacteriales bacterium]|nr:MAG: insulinase family protein [Sphingobacteriales bacterium]
MHTISHYLLRRLLAGAVLLCGAGLAKAQDLTAPLPKDPKVIKGKLPNGITYYIRPNSKPEKKVELRLAVNTGSIMEDDDQQGLAHFMEHMNFNGTKNFKKNELVDYLQSIGVQFGADLNAYTSFDETVYILPIPTDKEGNLDKGFQIIEDWAHNALLTNKDIDDERGVVLEESRMGKGADDRMMMKYLPKLMMGSRYANRLPIGKDEILKNFKHDVVRRFYNDWYRPDMQAVAIAGDIDSATAMKYILKHFAGLKNPAKPRERTMFEVPARQKPDAVVLTDKEATNYQLQIIYPAQKGKADKTLGDYRQSLMQQMVTSIINRRLSDLAKGSNPPFPYAMVGYGEEWARGYENFSAFAMFGEEGPEKALNALTAELVRVKQFGFNETEVELTRKSMLSMVEKMYNERNTTESSNYVDEYVRNFLQDEAIPGIENEFQYYKQLLPGIKATELNNIIKDWMSSPNTFTLVTGPDKEETKLPNDKEMLAMTQKGFQQQVQPLEEKKVATSLLAKKPTPGKVTGQVKDEELGATTYTLSNGAKVTIKQTNFKSDEILLNGVKKGGTNNYGVADKSNAKYAATVAAAMGFGEFAPSDIDKVIAGKPVKIGMNMQPIQNAITGSSNVKDFETLLQLMYLRLTAPRIDESLFKAYVDKQKTQIQFLTQNPQISFFDTTLNVLYKNNPLAPVPFPKAKDFEELNMARAIDIYKNEFTSADGYHFFLVGNVDPAAALPLIETYIGSIPSANKEPKFSDNGVRPVPGLLSVKKGSEKQSLIIASYTGELPYSEDFKMKAEALAEVLNIKVIEEMREKLGSIYTGGYYASVAQFPYPHYSMAMQLPCGPENVDKLLAAANDEIKALKEKGPDQKDIDKVKNQWKEAHRTEVQENKYWSEALANVLFWGNDKNGVLQYDQRVDKLTPADIQQVAKQMFNGKNEFISVLYPENFKTDKPRSSN